MTESPIFTTARRGFFLLGSGALLIVGLYFGQKILIPLALAVLLTFVLAPLVLRMERRGLSRVHSVLIVVCLAFLLIGVAGWAIASQVTSLVDDLPHLKKNVRERIIEWQGVRNQGLLARVQEFLEEVEEASQPTDVQPGQVIRVQMEKPSLFNQARSLVDRFVGIFSAIVVVFLLVISMLIYREDLRNRLIRLAGRSRLTLTTRALDEAGRRIGRYLLGRSLVNASFGIAVGAGLFLIGIPYSALWGMLFAILRFVPSIGLWLVIPFPVGLALINSPDLVQPILALAFILLLELLSLNVIEPRVFGPSIGVAPVPLLVSVLFWTGLWGLVGLVLATPLTVCLAVLGKHVPQLEFLGVLLGSRPALPARSRYYQRLLARDRYEAAAILKDFLSAHSFDKLCDVVLVPALVLVRRGRRSGELKSDDEQFILQTTRELVEELGQQPAPASPSLNGVGGMQILGIPARDEVDEVSLLMFRQVIRAAGHDILLAGNKELPSGVISLVHQERPALVFIVSVGSGGLVQTRYLCRRLRTQFPALQIVIGWLGHRKDPKASRKLIHPPGADRVVTKLREARTLLAQLSPVPSRLEEET